MIFNETSLQGAYVIQLEFETDERGFFARSWCQQEFADRGLNCSIVQSNISYNKKKGTLRGMHYQVKPHEEVKLVRCSWGCIYDVIVDLRECSVTMNQWFGVELSAANRKMLYVPEGIAHGLVTLEDDSEVVYQMSKSFHPESARVLAWDDPAIGIQWPIEPVIISPKDAAGSER